MKDYIKLLRIKHYIKNLLIFVPLFFSKELFERHVLERTILGAICFSIISSVVYILNDIKDVEKDRIHPKKKNRPIASGKVSKRNAVILLVICFILAVAISFLFLQGKGFLILMFYFGLNVAYSVGLKNIPIIDIIILTSGFVIRIVYGGGLVILKYQNGCIWWY